MRNLLRIIFLLTTTCLFAQKKLVDNSAASNSPANGPSYLIVSEDDTKMTYVGNSTQFFFVDIPNSSVTSTTIGQFTESEKVGNTIFGRGIVSGSAEDLVYATTDGVFLLDYFQSGSNFPRIWSGTANGAAFGSGKFDPDNAGRDFIRVDPDLTTVTRPFNNVTGGGVDLINKDLYQVQMVPFAENKILVKAKRTSADEEYFVWDDINQTSTQITDIANSNADASTTTKWPLGKGYGDNVIFYYYDKIYTNDGTATGTTEIATATNMVLSGIGGGDDYAIFGNEVAGDNEAYLYTDETTLTKIDLNTAGSSNPQDFISNGEYVFFIADTGDGYEPHISDGTISGTKLLMDINTSGGSMEPKSNYDINTSIAAGNGFVFAASDGTNSKIYFTDGSEVVLLDNYEEYIGLFISRPHAMAVTDDYLYFTDEDKDVFQVAIPDNIYNGSNWSNGEPVANQSLYFNADFTVSADITLHSAHIPSGVTVTIDNGATLTIDGYFYNKGSVEESGGTLNWIEPISFINLSPVIDKVTNFLDTAQSGYEVGQYPEAMLSQLTDSLTKATGIKANPQTKVEVDQMAENLNDYLKEVLWAKVWPINNYKNNLKIVFGDLKQAQINNQLISEDQIDFLLLGMKEAQVEGVRINIFGKDVNDVTLNPNKAMFDYFFDQAKAKGFKVFANPAEFQGARRIANNSFDDLSEVNGITSKSNRVIEIVKDFALNYECDYISPFNEDGLGGSSFSAAQVNSIFSSLVGELNGATLVGADNNNLVAGLSMVRGTDVLDYVSIATCHNLGFDHDLWDDYIAEATSSGLPVWESEATDNPKTVNGEEKESRLIVAVDAGVDGLVFYNNWAGISLETGNLSNGALASRTRYVDPYENVSSIVLSGNTRVDLGSSITLTTTILPSTATDQRISWSSSDTQLATVDQNGLVTGISNGLVTITASAIDGSGIMRTFDVQSGDILISDINITGNEEMFIGDTQTLSTEILPTNADDQTFTWSSSNSSIATISAQGELAAISVGSAIITATANDAGGISETFEITINPILVSTLVISGASEMTISESQTLSVTILPEDATDKTFEWSSSNEDILTINSNGLVTANAIGTAVISATANDASEVVGELSIEVTSILVSGIVISGEDEMKVTETQTLTTLVFPANATDNSVIWSSSDVEIATVSTEGLVTPLLPGSVTITATANDASGIHDDFVITINPELVTEIDVVGRSAMIPGDTDTFTATVAPANATDKTFVWSSSNSSIATVDVTGLVTALAVGEVTITATANDASGVTGFILVTIEAEIIDVSDVTISGNTTMIDQSTQTLSVSILPNDATTKLVSWSSSDEEIAAVSQEGLVTAKSIGTATITATASDGSGVSDELAITVEPLLVTSVSIAGSSTMIDRGTQSLSAVVTPENATDVSVTWSSSNESIASVSSSGFVTATGIGEVTITATANDASASSAELVITVEPILISSVDITGNESMFIGGSETFVAVTSPENATDATVTWTSSNTALATVTNAGVVTALGLGTVTITATATDASAVSGSIEVTINPVLLTTLEITGNETMIDQSTQTLILTTTPTNATNQNVTWTSSNETVATVDDLGVVIANGVGNVTITATAQDASGISTSISITVGPLLVSALEITGNSNIVIGDTQTLVATASPQNATITNVTWSSSNTEVLTVSATGEVTAISVGTATVTAAAIDGSGVTQTISIEVSPKLVSEITIEGSQSMIATTTQSLVAQIAPTDATNTAVTWASDNVDVATVNEEGLVTALATGTVTITATAADESGISGNISIEVTPLLVSAISITGEASMIDGSTQTLTATVTPSNATDVSVVWTSSDESIATVSATGEVTALDPGMTTITATANDASGVSANLEITVDPILVASISITGNAEITEGETLQLAAIVTPDNANDMSVIWSVNDASLATISETGLLTSLLPGTVTVTATANDASEVFESVDIVIITKPLSTHAINVEVSVYPNPAQDLLTITSSGNSGIFDYKLINLSGKIIEEQTSNVTSQTIDVSQLKRGIYILTIMVDGEKAVHKLILD